MQYYNDPYAALRGAAPVPLGVALTGALAAPDIAPLAVWTGPQPAYQSIEEQALAQVLLETQPQAGDELPLGAGLGAGLFGGLIPGLIGGAVGGLTGSPIAAAAAQRATGVALAPGTELATGHETYLDGVPVGGPGVPEPPKHMIAKEWNVKVDSNTYGTFRMYYFKLIDGRQMSYHSPTKTWKIWRPKKHIVISSNPRVKMLSKLNRLNKRVTKMLKPYQPRAPKTRLVPSRALSAIERAELKA